MVYTSRFGDFPFQVANIVHGNIETFEKFGRNEATGTGAEDIWHGGGLYTGFPTGAAETMEILSSSTADTAAGEGGTGARTVTIKNLLDADGGMAGDLTVPLNGQTTVSLGATTYTRSTRILVKTAGSGGGNAGELTLRHTTTTANVFATVPAGYNRTLIAAYTVPVGKRLFINRANCRLSRPNGAAGSASMTFRARPDGEVFDTIFAPELTHSESYNYDGPYLVFEAKTDIKWRAESTSNAGSIISAEFSGYLASA